MQSLKVTSDKLALWLYLQFGTEKYKERRQNDYQFFFSSYQYFYPFCSSVLFCSKLTV